MTILVDDHRITVTWNPDPARQSPVDFIVAKLQRGQRAEGIQLLELMRSREPDNVDALYNLGIALSDAGRLNQAERYLRQVVELAPTFVNGLVGLGVALSRQQKNDEATVVLQRAAPAIPQGPANQPGGPQPGFLNSEKIGCRLSRLRVFGASHS